MIKLIEHFDESLFEFSKASEFSDPQIFEYWVDIAGKAGLLNLLRPGSVKPLLLLGGKGSGKTHLMRYCSGAVQKLRFDGSLSKSICGNGYLGIYAGADGLNVERFSGKGIDHEVWDRLFSYYFDLWLALKYLDHIVELVAEEAITPTEQERSCERIRELFDVEITETWRTFSCIRRFLADLMRQIDFASNNCVLTGDLGDLEIKVTSGRLVFTLPQVLSQEISLLGEVRIAYLIDEVENFSESQQIYLNTLIRYRSGVATVKLGARLYGIKTFDTRGSGEPIKRGSEYEVKVLDSYLRENEKGYARFIRDMLITRLRRGGLQVGERKSDLDELFETLDSRPLYQKSTLELVGEQPPSERPYFRRLVSEIEVTLRGMDKSYISEVAGAVVHSLSAADYPLLEKLNIFLLYREWGDGHLSEKAAEIGLQCASYLEGGKKKAPQYAAVLDHYALDMLAQLYRDCGKRPVYAGLDTIISLSQGIPRNFLEIMKYISSRSAFIDDRSEGSISVRAQSEGIRDAAAWFWSDAQPDAYGHEVREGVERMAELLRAVRYSSTPAECGLVAFSIRFSTTLDPAARKLLDHAINWSFLIHIRDGRSNKNSEALDEKFRIAPMLAPKWGLPEGRRGCLEIDAALFNAIFGRCPREEFQSLVEERVKGMNAPLFGRVSSAGQGDLFS